MIVDMKFLLWYNAAKWCHMWQITDILVQNLPVTWTQGSPDYNNNKLNHLMGQYPSLEKYGNMTLNNTYLQSLENMETWPWPIHICKPQNSGYKCDITHVLMICFRSDNYNLPLSEIIIAICRCRGSILASVVHKSVSLTTRKIRDLFLINNISIYLFQYIYFNIYIFYTS